MIRLRQFALLAVIVLLLPTPAAAQFNVKVGVFDANTGTPPFDQTVTEDGIAPKAIIFWSNNAASPGFFVTAIAFIGMTSGAANSRAAAWSCATAVSTTDCNKAYVNKAIQLLSSAGADVGAADLKTFGANGFTITWTTNPASGIDNHYAIFYGADLTNVKVTEHTMQSGTGNKSYTGVGFQGDMVILLSGSVTATGLSADAKTSIGVCESSTKRGAAALTSRAAQTMTSTVDAMKVQSTTSCFRGLTTANPAVEWDWDFVSFDSDGFTVNQVTASSTLYLFTSMVFKGGSYEVAAFSKPTDAPTVTNDVAVGFAPKGAISVSWNAIASTSVTADADFSFGVSDFTNEGAVYAQNKDASIPSNANRISSVTKGIVLAEAGALNSEADLSANGNNVRYSWTTNDAVAQQVLLIAFGDTPAVTGRPKRRTVRFD